MAVVALALVVGAVLRDRTRLGTDHAVALAAAWPFLFVVGLVRFAVTGNLDDRTLPWAMASVYLAVLVVSGGHPALVMLDMDKDEDRELLTGAEALRVRWQQRALLAVVLGGLFVLFWNFG